MTSGKSSTLQNVNGIFLFPFFLILHLSIRKTAKIKTLFNWEHLLDKSLLYWSTGALEIITTHPISNLYHPHQDSHPSLTCSMSLMKTNMTYVSPSNRPVRHIPDRSIRLPDRPRSFKNLGPVRFFVNLSKLNTLSLLCRGGEVLYA